jgi:hypothetical protein
LVSIGRVFFHPPRTNPVSSQDQPDEFSDSLCYVTDSISVNRRVKIVPVTARDARRSQYHNVPPSVFVAAFGNMERCCPSAQLAEKARPPGDEAGRPGEANYQETRSEAASSFGIRRQTAATAAFSFRRNALAFSTRRASWTWRSGRLLGTKKLR